ncbi:hypothetical protein T11_17629 [Trichinella zimbabwensis]|uniref:Uncharacterized protein n=1 Tax=Trichinella zimbabwensis TaxID=268475 RepID=A0A0V1HTM0_9BILA|nr:hypothetical protein T11_17629 [Trichinella zimbabwensis]
MSHGDQRLVNISMITGYLCCYRKCNRWIRFPTRIKPISSTIGASVNNRLFLSRSSKHQAVTLTRLPKVQHRAGSTADLKRESGDIKMAALPSRSQGLVATMTFPP